MDVNKCIRLSLYGFLLIPVLAFADRNDREHDEHEREHFPAEIQLPNGFRAEGIVRGRGHVGFAGSLRDGDIYKFDFRTGEELDTFEGEPGDIALGMAFDKGRNQLYVAGFLNGTVTVYDSKTGDKLAIHHIAPPGGLVNDGIVAKDAAYFTDTFIPQIYRIPRYTDRDKSHDSIPMTIPLSGDFEFIPGQVNANGIETTNDKNGLYVINSTLGKLYYVDKQTGHSIELPISGGSLVNGDGLYRDDDKLYVSQNFFNQISVVELAEDGMSGQVVKVITDPRFMIPTTVTVHKDGIYAVNARFDIAPPPFPGIPAPSPEIEYQIIRVELEDEDD